MEFGQRPLERVLHQVIGPVAIPRQGARIAPQAGDVRDDLCTLHQNIIAMPDSLRDDVPDLVEAVAGLVAGLLILGPEVDRLAPDRKSTRLNSSHLGISYAV